MSRNVRRFTASALVDRDVNKYSAVLHFRQILFLKELRSRAARDQNGTDHEVSVLADSLDIGIVTNECLNVRAEHVVEFLKTLQVNIQNSNVRAHTDSDLAGVHANGTATEDNDVCLRSTRNTCEQDALTAELLFEILRAFLNGKTAGDLRHRSQTRQRTVLFLQCLVSNGLDLACDQCIGLLFVSSQVQICVEDEALSEQRIFLRKRLLDLDHHVHEVPDISGVIDQRRARIDVFIVRKTGTDARALFHVNMVAGRHIGFHVVRRQADAELIVLDLFYTTDLHKSHPHSTSNWISSRKALFAATFHCSISICEKRANEGDLYYRVIRGALLFRFS